MSVTHVVTAPRAPFAIAGGALQVHQVPMWRDNLGWLIVDPATGSCAAVDGTDSDELGDYMAARDLRLAAILNTHTHYDHVGFNKWLAKRGRLEGVRVYGPARAADDVPGLTDPVDDGDTVTFAGVTARVWLTEGHIDGHVSYVFDGAVFCGDTMFGAGCGRLFDGPAAKMHASLQRLAELPGTTRMCCAHEYTEDNLRFAWTVEPNNPSLAERIRRVRRARKSGASSIPSLIAEERATNPFVRTDSTELRTRVAAAMGIAADAPDHAIMGATRALKDRGDYRNLPDSELP